ncbi:MAG: acyl-CoA thioesterase II [Gammaproteobacteria bacterium AqS3]|nr:acyl-CoA thioesterase II [Gammaproteobacteria bacterium AqS3]
MSRAALAPPPPDDFDVDQLFQLETLDRDIFRGLSQWSVRSVFGGQVIGQALLAASLTIEDDARPAHSLHAYFLRPGDPNAPIVYYIERIRNGRSFSTRRIVAVQHGEPIFNMDASFHLHEEGLEYQMPMPDVTPPEELRSESDLRGEYADRLPPQVREMFLRPRPVELRPVEPYDLFNPEPKEPLRHQWMRSTIALGDDPRLQQALLAYASDMSLMGTSMLPHGITFMKRGYFGASLDHAMWFHRDFDLQDWLLYVNDSPVAHGARGYNRGLFYTRDGALVASTMQEGLVRYRPPSE